MFKLIGTQERIVGQTKRQVRTWRNDTTGGEISTYLLTTDPGGNKWWAFENLYELPFIRTMAANKIVRLYGNDLLLEDILAHTKDLKALLRSSDGEKYEKAYAKVLELETLSTAMADPVKQCIGLCTLYVLVNDERPDAYVQSEQSYKMNLLALDVDLQTFFLRWWTEVMQQSGKDLKLLSLIASTINQSAINTGEQSG